MSLERHVRVLVTFDCTHPNERVLRQLTKLLGATRLDVTGLYVEDEDLLRAARLPGLREISFTGQLTDLDATRMGYEIQREAAAAAQAFELLARQLAAEHEGFAHRFLIARGRIAEEVGRAASGCDFVMVTRALRATGLRPRLGRAYHDLVQRAKQVLFVNEPWASGTSLVVLHDSGPALDYARRLADAEGLRLVIAVPRDTSPETAAALTKTPNTSVRELADLGEETLADLCFEEDARLLMVDGRDDLDWSGLLVSLMDKLPCSLLKVSP
jgi:nucleotide-binding universal stress UspA family protein